MSETEQAHQDRDIEVDDDRGVDGGEPPVDAEALQAEVDILKDKLLRAVAEAENVRRRAEQEKRDAARYGVASFARDLIDVADNLERAVAAAETDGAEGPLLDGVRMIEKALQGALERNGVRKIAPKGEKFDPNAHQAIAEAPSPDHPAGVVCDVAQPGYLIGDRVLRAASVVVSKGDAQSGGQVDMTA